MDDKSCASELDHLRREERAKRENAHALQEERFTSTKLVIQQRLAPYKDKMVYKLPAFILEPGTQ